ncbi:MAG: hypothetical protein R3B99_00205 [Polyangiales bacterium]
MAAGLGLLVGCDAEGAVRCRFEGSRSVGRTALGTDQVALVDGAAGLLATWTSSAGWEARRLDGDGEPTGSVVRLGPSCDAGLAVRRDGSGWTALCGHRARPDKAQEGALRMLVIDEQLAITRSRVLATLGRDAQGVDLARHDDGSWSVVWHDGHVGRWNVQRARVRPDEDGPVDAEPLSSGVLAASPYPRVQVREDRALFVFEEFWLDAGFARGRVSIARERGMPIAVEELEDRDGRAQLVHDGRSWVLVFRDLRRPSPKASLYARRLGDDLRPIERARRITRADADGSPRALMCDERLAVVVPRTWDTDVLVGIDLLDTRLRKVVAEQQIYEWSARFPHADAVCHDGRVITLAASRAWVGAGEAPLHTIGLHCTP